MYISLIHYYFTVTAQEGPGIVIVHPAGQDVELLCTVMKIDGVVWLIGYFGPYGVSALHNGIVAGYSANITTNNLIIENIMMNDVRNNTEYWCGLRTQNIPTIKQSKATTLHVAGEYHYVAIMPNKNSLGVVKKGTTKNNWHNVVTTVSNIGDT